jgi:hypothetical protein
VNAQGYCIVIAFRPVLRRRSLKKIIIALKNLSVVIFVYDKIF